MGSHFCHARGCEETIPPEKHMCQRHWKMVPRFLQRQLWSFYRPGQEVDKIVSPEYLDAAMACIEAVAMQEGRR